MKRTNECCRSTASHLAIPKSWTLLRLALVGAMVITALATGCSQRPSETRSSPIRIGAILPFTGSSSTAADFARKGITLAVEQANANRQSNHPEIEIDFGDSKNSAKDGLAVFNEQEGVRGIRFFMASNSGVVVPLSQSIGKRDDVFLMTTFSSAPGIPTYGPNIFRLFVTAENEAATMARFLRSRSISRVAVFYINDDFGLGGSRVFKETFTGEGGRVLWEETWDKSGLDIRSRLQKMPGDSQALYIIGYEAGLGLSVKHARENGYTGIICTTVGMSLPPWRAAAGEAAEGVYFTNTGFTPNSTNSSSAAFSMAFTAKYGEAPNSFSGFAYDAITSMIRGMYSLIDSGRSVSPSELSKVLVDAPAFDGAVGTIKFAPDREAAPPLSVWMIRGGVEVISQ